jgi:hypothetical protein
VNFEFSKRISKLACTSRIHWPNEKLTDWSPSKTSTHASGSCGLPFRYQCAEHHFALSAKLAHTREPTWIAFAIKARFYKSIRWGKADWAKDPNGPLICASVGRFFYSSQSTAVFFHSQAQPNTPWISQYCTHALNNANRISNVYLQASHRSIKSWAGIHTTWFRASAIKKSTILHYIPFKIITRLHRLCHQVQKQNGAVSSLEICFIWNRNQCKNPSKDELLHGSLALVSDRMCSGFRRPAYNQISINRMSLQLELHWPLPCWCIFALCSKGHSDNKLSQIRD